MEESAAVSLLTEFDQLRERARRARDEADRLIGEHRFIVWWHGMRPKGEIRPVPMLD